MYSIESGLQKEIGPHCRIFVATLSQPAPRVAAASKVTQFCTLNFLNFVKNGPVSKQITIGHKSQAAGYLHIIIRGNFSKSEKSGKK
jgi:hypothetical protein